MFYISSLPLRLTHLQLLGPCQFTRSFPFPPSIKYITVGSWINDPTFASSNVTHLNFINNFNSSFAYSPHFDCSSIDRPFPFIPQCLTHLTFGDSFNLPLYSLPSSLLYLDIESTYFNQPVDQLPLSLSYLRICSTAFTQPIEHLPPSLTSLIISSDIFCYPVESLPSLSHLELYFQDYGYPLPSSFTSICSWNETYRSVVSKVWCSSFNSPQFCSFHSL